jgi:hypothetical protein
MAAHEGGGFGSGDTGTGGSFNQIHRKPNNTRVHGAQRRAMNCRPRSLFALNRLRNGKMGWRWPPRQTTTISLAYSIGVKKQNWVNDVVAYRHSRNKSCREGRSGIWTPVV